VDEDNLRVRVTELRTWFDILLEHVVDSAGEEIHPSHDYFRALTKEDRRNVYEEPTSTTIGQISECLDNLRGLVSSGEPISYGFVWLAEVLRTIGEDIVR
jgi:hypothetical protein